MKTNYKLILVAIIITLITILIIFRNDVQIDLQGTFISNELPFASIAFDNNEYFYYNVDNGETIKDTGNIYKLENGNYILKNGNYFINTKLEINKKEITIEINNVKYKFQKFSKTPIINN